MSEIYAKKTGLALAQARVLLQAYEQESANDGWSQSIRQSAFRNAVLFHLAVALEAYFREIAERSNLSVDQIATLADLTERFAASGQITGEVTEFQQLAEDSASWYSRLVEGYRRCWQVETQRNSGKAETVSEINLVQLESAQSDEPLSPAEMTGLLRDFTALIDRQRSAMQEW